MVRAWTIIRYDMKKWCYWWQHDTCMYKQWRIKVGQTELKRSGPSRRPRVKKNFQTLIFGEKSENSET